MVCSLLDSIDHLPALSKFHERSVSDMFPPFFVFRRAAQHTASSGNNMVGVLEQYLFSGAVGSRPLHNPFQHDLAAFIGGTSSRGTQGRVVTQSIGVKIAVRMASLTLLWVFFRYRGDTAVLRVNCALLRPIAGFLSRRETAMSCGVGQEPLSAGSCAAPSDVCAVSYYVFAFLANSIVSFVFAALRGR
jgi:hypothetical protein